MVHNVSNMVDPALSDIAGQAGENVTQAIYKASQKTGTDFAYLMEKASAESSFRPDAQAKTSSARGLFQFIDSTWLRMINNYGAQHGLEKYAEMIDANGEVANPSRKQEILSLRDDPETAALMAAEFASENKRILQSRLGLEDKDIGANELYLAHFLGAGGASRFLAAKAENPDQEASSLLPAAAKANKAVFYHASGRARSVNEVYEFFAAKFKTSQKLAEAEHGQTNIPDTSLPRKESYDTDITSLQSTMKDSLKPSRNYNAMQKAFLAHQSSYDMAVRDLLLSPLARQNFNASHLISSQNGGAFGQFFDLAMFMDHGTKGALLQYQDYGRQ